MKTAVIGIGSNSVRMLLAEVGADHRAKKLLRDREGTRLFAGLDERGNLSAESMTGTVKAVTRMAEEARSMGASDVSLFATSATRDAGNQPEFERLLKDSAGLTLEICSGEEEAALSFLGATQGEYCGVIDIGGGSTEIVVGQGLDIGCAFSCQMGAVRLFQKLPIRSAADLPAVCAMARGILDAGLAKHPMGRTPESWIGVGGTFTTLAAMVKGISWTERTYMHGTCLTQADVRAWATKLADMPMAERLKLKGLQPHRADIVVHGVCILLSAMEAFGMHQITVSEYGNLDGYLKRKYDLTGEISE